MNDYSTILDYWFPNEQSIFMKFWFSSKSDQYIKTNFINQLVELEQDYDLNYSNPDELLSKIIVLDQFSRNIYRGTKNIIKNDEKALKLAKLYFENNFQKNHPLNKVIFALMPFRHSECLKDQLFVLEKLIELEEDSDLYNKFSYASAKSYMTIKEMGKFPDRDKLI
jgi:uncharacterized protein (DUF924 family)